MAVALSRKLKRGPRGSFYPHDPGMKNKHKNARTHIPADLYRDLAHLAVDRPGATVASLLLEGARLLLEKYRRAGHPPEKR